MSQRQRKHRLNLSRRADVRYPWMRAKDWDKLRITDHIGSYSSFRFIESPPLNDEARMTTQWFNKTEGRLLEIRDQVHLEYMHSALKVASDSIAHLRHTPRPPDTSDILQGTVPSYDAPIDVISTPVVSSGEAA